MLFYFSVFSHVVLLEMPFFPLYLPRKFILIFQNLVASHKPLPESPSRIEHSLLFLLLLDHMLKHVPGCVWNYDFFFWLCSRTCGILVPPPGIEPGPWQWKLRVLTTGLPGNSLKLRFNLCIWKYVYDCLSYQLVSSIKADIVSFVLCICLKNLYWTDILDLHFAF